MQKTGKFQVITLRVHEGSTVACYLCNLYMKQNIQKCDVSGIVAHINETKSCGAMICGTAVLTPP